MNFGDRSESPRLTFFFAMFMYLDRMNKQIYMYYTISAASAGSVAPAAAAAAM